MREKFIYRKLDAKDESELFHIMDVVLGGLERKELFIPYSEEEKKCVFDCNYAFHYGAFDQEKLVATNAIYVSENLIKDYYTILNIDKSKKIGELGGFLTLKEYSGQGLMTKLCEIQLSAAKELDFDYITATAHPENVSSCKILEKVGLVFFDTITTSSGYLRNVYWKKLNGEI
ncbi:MAG: GNAT family N-acetyltransferase [Lachnospiraceae bacterium]|nr:GNAT family N-acetyltransferase [Lachnospiraceae bacterium]